LVDGSKNEGLQVARAVAALSVAYFHSYIALRAFPESAQIPIGPLKDWGYLGVNLFFAISGYVICLVASKPTFSPASFAIKRVFRLFPMYWVAMATIAFMITIGKYRPEPLGHFLYSMTLLPQSGPSAYDVSWTLERELVFYALATVTVPFAGIPGLAIVLTTLAAAGWYFGNPWSYHLLSTIHADFLAGVVLFLFHDRTKRLGTIAPIAIGMAMLAYTRSHDFVFSVPLCMGLILLGMINLRLPWDRWPLRWIVQAGDVFDLSAALHRILLGSIHFCPRSSNTTGLALRTMALRHARNVLPHLGHRMAAHRTADDPARQPGGRRHVRHQRSSQRCFYGLKIVLAVIGCVPAIPQRAAKAALPASR